MTKLFKLKDYGKIANSYDLAKAIALIFMIIAHIGGYFFPENLWPRVTGRIAFPCFAFLIGYSQNYKFNKFLFIGACLTLLSTALLKLPIFPLNILWSVLIWRAIMQKLVPTRVFQRELPMIWVMCMVFCMPFYIVTDYSTLGIMFMTMGYLTREGMPLKNAKYYWISLLLFWIVTQSIVFKFSLLMNMVFIAETLLLFWWLSRFKVASLPRLPFNMFTLICARNSLIIYVLHIIAFQCIMTQIWPERQADHIILWRINETSTFP